MNDVIAELESVVRICKQNDLHVVGERIQRVINRIGAVSVTIDAIDGDQVSLGSEVTLHIDGAQPSLVKLKVGDRLTLAATATR